MKTLSNAPKESIMLSKEVHDLSAILHEIHLTSLADIGNGGSEHELQQTSVAQNATFASQIKFAKGQIVALDAFVKALT